MADKLTPENLKNRNDEELLELVYTEGDRLTREVVDEIVRRGEIMIEPLAEIIEHTYNWTAGDEKWWSPIHAVNILGAISEESVIDPILMALRFSDAFEVDWIWEDIPSIFGSVGTRAADPLKHFACDRSNTSFCRGIALDSLAAIALEDNNIKTEIFDFIAQFLKDEYEDMELRGSAGVILLDFGEKRYEKSLLRFAEDERAMKARNPFYIHMFDIDDIENIIEGKNNQDLERYRQNWLDFYNENEIAKRQERWRKENSLRGKISSFWLRTKMKKNLKKYADEKLKSSVS